MDEAPAFQDIEEWINSEPLTLDELSDTIVLLHFWTYTSATCRRVLPHIKNLWDTYGGDAFTVIGVHTPAFDFERDAQNVQDAVERLGVEYPVALDAENTTWKLYGNRYWPRQALIDQEGRIREENVGEGGHAHLEERIRRLIRWEGGDLDDAVFEDEDAPATENDQFISPDIHGGEKWGGELGNADVQVCSPYARIQYRDEQPGNHELNRLYLNGEWIRESDHLLFTEESEERTGYAALRFSGRTCNAVLAAEDGAKAYVTLDGEPVPADQRGADISEDDDGTFVSVSRPDTYHLVEQDEVDIGEIMVIPENTGFRLYAFNFG